MLTYLNALLSGAVDPFWPHVVLLTTSVVAGIAVGAGIIFESSEYSAAVHRVAKWLVIVGIAIESLCTISLFVFDKGISNAQQSKIIELETRIAPRDLTDTQQKEIADKLKPFAGMHFDLEMTPRIEIMKLLDKIENALLLAGWKEQPPRPEVPQFDRISRSKVGGARSVAGVWVLWPQPSGEPFKSAADTLVSALKDKGITASLVNVVNPDAYDSDKIHVWVGDKP